MMPFNYSPLISRLIEYVFVAYWRIDALTDQPKYR